MKSHKHQVTSLKKQLISSHAVSSAFSPIQPILPIKPRFAQFACLAALLAALLSGCATEKIAESLATKNTSGNGTVVNSRIGIDPDTKIPALKTLFISGDFATTKAGTNQVSYREESSASIWNASSVTKKRFLAITLTDAGDVPAAIKAVAEVFITAEAGKPAEKAEADAKKDEVRTAQ